MSIPRQMCQLLGWQQPFLCFSRQQGCSTLVSAQSPKGILLDCTSASSVYIQLDALVHSRSPTMDQAQQEHTSCASCTPYHTVECSDMAYIFTYSHLRTSILTLTQWMLLIQASRYKRAGMDNLSLPHPAAHVHIHSSIPHGVLCLHDNPLGIPSA